MTEALPTLHHLNNSQSQRILWLLEELGIPYNLELYKRGTTGSDRGRAPASLKKVHPLGKSPALVTSDGRTITESSVIASYLIDKYDTVGKFKGDAATGNDALRDDTLTSFAGNSMGVVIAIETTFDLLVKESPFFIRPLFKGVKSAVNKTFTGGEFDAMFSYLNKELGDQVYFMGANPGRADFIMSWQLDQVAQHQFVDLKKYPKVDQWYQRIQARPAWKRSLEKGNGYDLSNF